jgi:biopolymer transport protein ExbD
MAGAGPSPSPQGRRKSLDAEINLVPFIDLLSMCICFLLMTAVWMEIGAVNVKQLVGTEGAADSRPSYEMDLKYTTAQQFEVAINRSGKKAEKFVVDGVSNEERLTRLRDGLKSFGAHINLNLEKDLRLQMGQAISVARVTTRAGVSYGEVVSVMDTLRDLGIVNLGLVPVR